MPRRGILKHYTPAWFVGHTIKRPPLRAVYNLAVAILMAVSACTRFEYSKPDITEEVFLQDSAECAEIARRQAFHDYGLDIRLFHARYTPYSRTSHHFHFGEPSRAEIERRYRRVCMFARGYELTPVPEP